MECAGIIVTTRFRIESVLKEKKAFDEQSAADANDSNLNIQTMIDSMERNGLIAKTPEGKIFMTKKGQEQQIRGLQVSSLASDRKFVRFSRNK